MWRSQAAAPTVWPHIASPRERRGRGVEFVAEMADRLVGGVVGERVKADGEGFGLWVGEDIDLGAVDGAQQERASSWRAIFC